MLITAPRLFSLLFGVVYWLKACRASGSNCRCLYGDSCWPSDAQFNELAAQLSQPLVHPLPAASPCYSGNASECAQVQASWLDPLWRANQSGAMQGPNFEGYTFPNGTIEACYRNTSLGVSCGQGSVSVIGVDARTVSDVQAAVRFAANNSLRLVVKNTGHDYFGRSDGRGSFSIWTHHMKDISFNQSFTPAGAPADEVYEDVLTIGAGVQWFEAYAAAKTANRVLVGGLSGNGTVGAAGGWIQGAGHSALSPTYGLGIDNVLEFSVVTSTGDYLTVNAHQHSDLFWALRGGGGGTYGVITSLTYRTHPSNPVNTAGLVVTINGTRPNSALAQLCTELVRVTPELTDLGWGGYSQFSQASDDAYEVYVVLVNPNASSTQANATMHAFLDYALDIAANSTTTGDPADVLTVLAAQTVEEATWYDWYEAMLQQIPGQVGTNVELGSWLIPRETVEEDHEHVADTLIETGEFAYYLVAGGAVSNVSTSAAGVNPAWRNAAFHALVGTTWEEGTPSDEINQLRDGLKNNTAKLRALAPDSGAYFNEASLYEPDPAWSFFGTHYTELRAIKAVYDPVDLFVVTEGVGSDEWDQDLVCRV